MKYKLIFLFAMFFAMFFGIVSAVEFSSSSSSFGTTSGYASYVNYGTPWTYNQFYTQSDLNAYWPILGTQEECKGRQDMILQVAPLGCQPTVVRSDLLEEQNVPVFCQIQSVNVNPYMDVKSIRNIVLRTVGKTDPIVAGTGFHPANAALKTTNTLTGSPIAGNIGYAVVVLKKTPNESAMPENVKLTLNAQVQFDTANSIGVGNVQFSLTPMTDEEWQNNKMKYSFWQGRFYLRLIEASATDALVSVYQGDRIVSTQRVPLGQTSSSIYLPGLYCQAGLQVNYAGFVAAQTKATIEISSLNGVDTLDVYEGSKFFNDQCSVNSIVYNSLDGTGNILAYCGSQTVKIAINPKLLTMGDMIPAQDIDGRNDNYLKIGPLARDSSTKSKINSYVEKASTAVSGSETEACEVHLKYPSVPSGSEGYYSIQRDKSVKSDWQLYKRTDIAQYRGDSLEKDMTKEGNVWMSVLKQELIVKCEGRDTNKTITEKIYPEPVEANVNQVIQNYSDVSRQYPRDADVGKPAYGESALKAGIDFADFANKQRSKGQLIDQFVQSYSNSSLIDINSLISEKGKLDNVDSSRASQVVTINGQYVTIKLLNVQAPEKKVASADFSWGGKTFTLGVGEKVPVETRSGTHILELKNLIDISKVQVGVTCDKQYNKGILDRVKEAQTVIGKGGAMVNGVTDAIRAQSSLFIILNAKQSDDRCGDNLVLENVNIGKVAQIKLISQAKQLNEDTNITVNIGIEKRAIKLTPAQTEDRIDTLNETIKKIDSINENLKTVVSGLKAACFATSAFMTAKTFLSGLSGEGIARQEVMRGQNGWDQKCQAEIATTKKTLSQCFSDHADEINKDVAAYSAGINNANEALKKIEGRNMVSAGLGGGQMVDKNASAQELIDELRSKYGDRTVKIGDKDVAVSDWLSSDAYAKNDVSYQELRDSYAILSSGTLSDTGQARLNSDLTRIASDVNSREQFTKLKDTLSGSTLAQNLNLKGKQVYSYGNTKSQQGYYEGGATSPSDLTKVGVSDEVVKTLSNDGKDIPSQIITYDNQPYLVLLGATSPTGLSYTTRKVYSLKSDYSAVSEDVTDKTAGLQVTKGINVFNRIDANSYNNPIENPEVKYYETDPNKGMPAQVPVDSQKGWYVATQKSAGGIGTSGTKTFSANGGINSFWLCNVGQNRRIEFFSGMGDDICEQINLQTGQPLNQYPGLSTSEASALVKKATQALNDAANGYKAGVRSVRVLGQQYNVGSPSTGGLGNQCQDFMDPKDCLTLFNVCDPVICPASRCDFGGRYPVTDVIQSGIVGSTLLCLPNWPEVKVPVCLTGIQAGLDAFNSVLKSYRDCLQASKDTGQTVGICDEINSIYMCEFFWKQAIPLADTLIPKMFEMAVSGGQGSTKGGGEYLLAQSAWDNAKKSMDYFSQTYAVNSLKAFQIRNTEEAGTEVCKSFISITAPNGLKNLLEPDSPPQFYAKFDSMPYSDATVPPTAQYKVFYQIYSGQDSGVYYTVYLKGAPDISYYYSAQTIQVASGFAAKGQSASQTRDFTAPQGYKQLCVRINGQEQCGFGQVSTDFALNSIKDAYVANQLTQTGITSPANCIGGSASPLSLANPNLQSGADSLLNPQIYNQGIVRICATSNPGMPSAVTRFVDVGYCDDSKIRCWLDSQSVSNAITSNNVGLVNDTLSQLNNITIAGLLQSGQVDSITQSDDNIKKLTDGYNTLVESLKNKKFNPITANALIGNITDVLKRTYMNQQKANLLLLQAQTKELIGRYMIGQLNQSSTTGSSVDDSQANVNYLLSKPYTSDPNADISLMLPADGSGIGVNIRGGKVYSTIGTAVQQIGIVQDGNSYFHTIQLYESASAVIGSEKFGKLNDAVVSDLDQNVVSPESFNNKGIANPVSSGTTTTTGTTTPATGTTKPSATGTTNGKSNSDYKFVLSQEFEYGTNNQVDINFVDGTSSRIYIKNNVIYSVVGPIGKVVSAEDGMFGLQFDASAESQVDDPTESQAGDAQIAANIAFLRDAIISVGSKDIQLDGYVAPSEIISGTTTTKLLPKITMGILSDNYNTREIFVDGKRSYLYLHFIGSRTGELNYDTITMDDTGSAIAGHVLNGVIQMDYDKRDFILSASSSKKTVYSSGLYDLLYGATISNGEIFPLSAEESKNLQNNVQANNLQLSQGLHFVQNYDPSARLYLYDYNKVTSIYFQNNKVYLDVDWSTDYNLGAVVNQDGQIVIKLLSKTTMPYDSSGVVPIYYDKLSSAKIEGNKIVSSSQTASSDLTGSQKVQYKLVSSDLITAYDIYNSENKYTLLYIASGEVRYYNGIGGYVGGVFTGSNIVGSVSNSIISIDKSKYKEIAGDNYNETYYQELNGAELNFDKRSVTTKSNPAAVIAMSPPDLALADIYLPNVRIYLLSGNSETDLSVKDGLLYLGDLRVGTISDQNFIKLNGDSTSGEKVKQSVGEVNYNALLRGFVISETPTIF